MISKLVKPTCVASVCLLAIACERPEEVMREARQEQHAAQQKYNETVAAVYAQAAEAYRNAQSDLNKANTEANAKLSEAAARLNAEKVEAHVWLNNQTDELNKQLSELKGEVVTKPMKTGRENFDVQAEKLGQELDALKQRGRELDAATGQTLADAKVNLRAQIRALEKKISDLRSSS